MSMQADPGIAVPGCEEEGQYGQAIMEQIFVQPWLFNSSPQAWAAALAPFKAAFYPLLLQAFLLFPTHFFQHSFPSLIFQAPYSSHFTPQTLCSGFASPQAEPQALAALQLTV